MTRVINGIYDDVCIDTGFFLGDREIDILVEWLESYAKALENSWSRKGGEGDPGKQKFTKVRSFGAAVKRNRERGDGLLRMARIGETLNQDNDQKKS